MNKAWTKSPEYKAGEKHLKKVGAAHATGDALRVMYAELLKDIHSGNPMIYFEYLKGDDAMVSKVGKELLADRAKAWDVLMGVQN